MKKTLIAAGLATLLMGPATAQTAREQFEAGGMESFTNLEQSIGRELLRLGVPEDCLGQIQMTDVRAISALVANDGADEDSTRGQIRRIIERTCGDLN
ncbi:hypothetical protein [Pontivivens ytuae]|uniref:Uncharacterized protein n=1 Tax=Pontivivens ytuae TaxID=2789856 RepID=A0A7S9LS52_9RHOB|nr:hypothetical protein [Pontivivens ytuae]QPH53950.1 hypothetical protein I0K15_19610 [Pontivivens ytuae]